MGISKYLSQIFDMKYFSSSIVVFGVLRGEDNKH